MHRLPSLNHTRTWVRETLSSSSVSVLVEWRPIVATPRRKSTLPSLRDWMPSSRTTSTFMLEPLLAAGRDIQRLPRVRPERAHPAHVASEPAELVERHFDHLPGARRCGRDDAGNHEDGSLGVLLERGRRRKEEAQDGDLAQSDDPGAARR